jgi:hypothetical protein
VSETGGTCSTHGGIEKCKQILFGKPEGKDHMGELDVDERKMLECILRKWNEYVDWI